MANIEFQFKGNKTRILCERSDKIKDIIQKYLNKVEIDRNTVYFLYSGNIIDNEELSLLELIGENHENINETIILVIPFDEINQNEKLVKSKQIICPKCGENILYKINNYKIGLSECKNNHLINDILFGEFENTQKIDISKIKCNFCQENMGNTFENKFYICLPCNKNLCPLCKSKHDKSHNIIDYENKNYICNKHNEYYIKYCNDCKKNICLLCENEHENHKSISYGTMIPNID